MTYKKLLSKTISVNVSILLLIQQSIIAGEIIVDSSANIINQATIEKAPNNVPVVNIVKPNESGLSHNKFSDYNVNKEGLILNNSNQGQTNTQLSGYIYGNKNLAGGNTAKTILNEVTSRNKTELRGFTEVAGDRANVVVANPNGIYINGAGFINTSKATITTGNISTINGNINHRVENGTIEIDAEGLNVSNVDKAELYAKTVKLNAQIHAKDIDIVTGKNKISEDGTIEKIDEVDTEKPSFSLDSSSLGGIYANKINLIGTQDGVGINLPIEITAQDDLKISADGKINLDRVVSNKNLEIKSNSNDVDTNIIYAQNVNIEAKNKINNKDIIASKTDINLKATKIVNKNLIASGVNEDLKDSRNGSININSDKLQNEKTIYAKNNVNINTKEVVNTKEAVIKSKKEINITSENIGNEDNVSFEAEENINLKNQNKIVSNKINIVSKQASVNIQTNTLEIKNSKVNANKDVILKAEEKIDAEDINVQANKIDVSTKELILSQKKDNSEDVDSKIVSTTTIDIAANNIKNVNGYIGANEDINITSKDIDNSNGVIVTNENLNINSHENGLFNNLKGILQASKNLILNVFDFKGDESIIQAENVNVKANDVNGKSSNIVALNGDLKLDTNNLNLSGDNLSKGLLYSTNDILINSKKFISNYLNVQANNNIDINSLDIALNNSTIQSVVDINDTYVNGYKQGNINLITSNLNLENVSLSSKDLTIKNEDNNKIQSLIVNNSILDVNSDINIQASVFNTKNSTYSSLRSLSLEATSIKDKNQNAIFTNSIFNSGNSMNITVDDDIVLDSSNKFEAINSITLNSKSLTNNAQFISNNNITINTSDYIINNVLLSSGNTITLNAVNYITNNDSNNELFGIRGAFTNLNTNLLTNYGLISSLYEMNIKANDIVNYGGIASANTDNYSSVMNITANNLSNYNTIYSNDNINLFIKDNILNQNAIIYATNNITIQGDETKTLRTNSIVNKSAVIQTNYGDINIFGNNILNGRSQEFDSLYESVVRTDKFRSSDGSYHIPESIRHRIIFLGHNDKKHHDEYYNVYYPEYNLIIHMGLVYNQFNAQGIDVNINEISKEDEITSKQSYIFSGKDLTLDTNKLTNEISNISSIGNIRFENSSMILENHELNFTAQLDFTTLLTEGAAYSQFNYLNTGEYIGKSNIYDPFFSYSYQNEIINSVIQSGEFIYGNINKLENGVIENQIPAYFIYNPTTNTDINNSNLSTSTKSTQNQTVLSNEATVESIQNESLNPIQNLNTNIENNNYELPANKYGMFTTVNPNKNLNYLVESNPLYTNMSNFTGSQYFLDKMNYQGDRITKRLGDAAYETKLITDSIVKQTGQRFLGNYTSENVQFVALMDSAVNLSGVLSLEVGKALSSEQLSNLSEDIVWMEEKIVAGEKVLVPVVYLAKDYEYLKGASITASKGIDLNVKNSLNNSGTIKSNNYLNLNANSIINNQGIILANGKASLISTDDFVNKNGGLIKANEVQIASINGNIINQTFAQTNKIQQGSNDFTYTLLGNESKIQSTKGNLILQAKNNIENIGSNLSASKTLSLTTQTGDINFKTLSLENGHNVYFKGGFDKALDIEHLKATASAGENVLIKSGNDINLEASKLKANNQINLNAQNDVNITAVNDVNYKDVQTTSKGFMSKKTQRDMSYKEEVQSAQLNANDIVINAQNDVNLEASKLKAQDNIVVFAKDGDVNVLAKEYKEGELHQTSKSSLAGLKKSLDIKSNDALKLNSALLETQAANVVITSGKDINILASEINSGADIQLKALNDVLITSQEEYLKTKEVHEKSSFNILGALDPLGMGMLDSSIYSKEVNKNEKLSATNISSALNAKENIIIDSGSTNIVGSNLSAKNVSIKADTGTVNILSSEDVFNESSLYKKIDFSLSNPVDMIKNEIKGLTEQKTKLKFELGSLTYDEVDKVSKDTVNTSSNITASEGNVVINSFDDVNIKGSNITASDAIAIKSEIGDVNITNAQDSTSTQTAEKHAKASVSVTVQNEFVEIGTAVKAALESAEQLKQVKSDYSNYKSEVKKLENTLTNLKQSYKNKEVGIDYSDIEDLVDIVDNVKSQEKYYVAALAAATADLASKTVAVISQGEAAGNSVATWGFSIGVSLDVNGEKSKTNTNSTKSLSSVLQANDIYIQTGDELKTAVSVIGSNIIAQNYLSIDTYDLNVKASQDTSTSNLDSQSVNGSVAFTMYGGGGGTAGLGYGQQNNSSDSLSNNNSQLIAKNIDIKIANDANFIGANVKASDTLNLNVGNNLVLESLRDEYSSNSNGFNVNAGIGFGSAGAKADRTPSADIGKHSSTNAGFSVNNGTTINKQTVLSSITGNKVNVNVGNNTHLKGSLISAGNFIEDGSFVDNKNLNFSTNTLSFENLSNTTYSSNQSIGGNFNYNLDSTKIVDKKEKTQQGGISSVGYNALNGINLSASKTLATLGQGNINIKDTANSDDLERLNTDTSKINKDLYSSSTGTSVDATLDTRLLSVNGLNQIKDDYNTASTILTSINQIVTTNRAGVLDFFNETQKNVDVLDGIKSTIALNPELAKQLSDSNITPEQKQSMISDIASSVAISLGYLAPNTKLVYTDEIGANNEQIKGHYSVQTDTSYVNDKNNDSIVELVNTTVHETQHYMDAKNNLIIKDKVDNEKYVNNFANTVTDYTNYALDYTGNQSMATTNNYNNQTKNITSVPSVFNMSSLLTINNQEFGSLDKSLGDDSISKIVINMNEYKNKTNYGTALVYVDGESSPREIKITSGNDTSDYTKSNAGPTPPDAYLIDPNKSQNMSVSDRVLGVEQSNNELSSFNLIRKNTPSFIKLGGGDWGSFRVPLEPASDTNIYNRTGMYIHGGIIDGSIGCIDCGNNDTWLFGEVRDTKKIIPVEIKYDENYKK